MLFAMAAHLWSLRAVFRDILIPGRRAVEIPQQQQEDAPEIIPVQLPMRMAARSRKHLRSHSRTLFLPAQALHQADALLQQEQQLQPPVVEQEHLPTAGRRVVEML